MKMTTRVAFDNMKYHKSRNILIGIAIILTTMCSIASRSAYSIATDAS